MYQNEEAVLAKHICSTCVHEQHLSNLIVQNGVAAVCDYCSTKAGHTWTIDQLSDSVELAFNDHMVRTPTEPNESDRWMYSDPDLNRTWYRDGIPTMDAIMECASIPQQAVEDVQAILEARHEDFDTAVMGEETEFSSDAQYEWKTPDANEWHFEWSHFERALKTEARFFNQAGLEVLKKVFEDIDQLRSRPRHPLVVNAGPGHRISHLYRARVFQSTTKLDEALCRPDLHLGSPPAKFSSAGRMNAKGISVFYGATESAVALAEVRPPVGSKVAVAKFNLLRPVKLLDLTALDHAKDAGSIFDTTLRRRLERVAFLRTLGARLTRPVMPDDEDFEYLITQAIADYLATVNRPRLDGIIFPSAQSKDGRNVVLFHSASLVKGMDFPVGTTITSSGIDEVEDSNALQYSVWEKVPAGEAHDNAQLGEFDGDSTLEFLVADHLQPTLAVDPKSVRVHHIDWVQVRSSSTGVRRFRIRSR